MTFQRSITPPSSRSKCKSSKKPAEAVDKLLVSFPLKCWALSELYVVANEKP
jgi:hypothetical protein